MAVNVERAQSWTAPKQLTLSVTVTDTPPIPMAAWTGLFIGIPVNSPITTLSFYGAMRQEGEGDPNIPAQQTSAPNYYQVTDPVSGNPITLTVAGGTGGSGNNTFAGQGYDVSLVLSPTGRINFASLKIVANQVGQIEVSKKA